MEIKYALFSSDTLFERQKRELEIGQSEGQVSEPRIGLLKSDGMKVPLNCSVLIVLYPYDYDQHGHGLWVYGHT